MDSKVWDKFGCMVGVSSSGGTSSTEMVTCGVIISVGDNSEVGDIIKVEVGDDIVLQEFGNVSNMDALGEPMVSVYLKLRRIGKIEAREALRHNPQKQMIHKIDITVSKKDFLLKRLEDSLE
jgi:hypothetical protein